jgi:hypothetical protein
MAKGLQACCFPALQLHAALPNTAAALIVGRCLLLGKPHCMLLIHPASQTAAACAHLCCWLGLGVGAVQAVECTSRGLQQHQGGVV